MRPCEEHPASAAGQPLNPLASLPFFLSLSLTPLPPSPSPLPPSLAGQPLSLFTPLRPGAGHPACPPPAAALRRLPPPLSYLLVADPGRPGPRERRGTPERGRRRPPDRVRPVHGPAAQRLTARRLLGPAMFRRRRSRRRRRRRSRKRRTTADPARRLGSWLAWGRGSVARMCARGGHCWAKLRVSAAVWRSEVPHCIFTLLARDTAAK